MSMYILQCRMSDGSVKSEKIGFCACAGFALT